MNMNMAPIFKKYGHNNTKDVHVEAFWDLTTVWYLFKTNTL